MAAAEINRRGGLLGRPVEIAFRDASDRSRSGTVVRDLVARAHPVAVIGTGTLAPAASASSVLVREKIASLVVGDLTGSIAKNPFMFRMTPSSSSVARVLIDWIVDERKIGRIAVLSTADPFGRDGASALSSAMASKAGEPVSRIEFPPGTIDLATAAQAVKAAGPDAVIVWAAGEDAARATIALRDVGVDAQIAGPPSLFEGSFRSLAGTRTDDVALVFPRIEPPRWFGQRMRDWFADYNARYSLKPLPGQNTLVTEIPMDALYAYDAVMLISEAVVKAGSDRSDRVAGALGNITGSEGVLRDYSFKGRSREATVEADLTVARFFNLAVLYDAVAGTDLDEQVAFYKVQVSAYFVPDEYLDHPTGKEVFDKVLEDVLTDPESVGFFRAYQPPRPPPGRL